MERIPDVSKRTPVHGDAAWETEADGRVAIEKRKFGPAAAKLLGAFRVPPVVTIRLDPIGSAAWRLMDGQRTVGDILAELRRDFPDEEDMASRLGEYLSTLVSNDLVRLE